MTPLPGAARGIDISSHNAEPNWTALKQGGVSFVAIKATEGDYYVNTATTTPVQQPGYAAEVTHATAAGMYVMPYAFGNPYHGNGSGTCQADYAWQEISSVTSPAYSSSGLMLPVVLDIEQDPYAATESNSNSCYRLSPSSMVTWIGQFLTEMQTLTHKTPALYTNPSFWSSCTGNSTAFSSYPLWLADWGIASPPALAGWGSPALWQYTDAGTVAGETGTVDADYLTPLKQGSAAGQAGDAGPGPHAEHAGQPGPGRDLERLWPAVRPADQPGVRGHQRRPGESRLVPRDRDRYPGRRNALNRLLRVGRDGVANHDHPPGRSPRPPTAGVSARFSRTAAAASASTTRGRGPRARA